jgi:hypothetical protein
LKIYCSIDNVSSNNPPQKVGQAVGQEKEFKNSFTNITRPIIQKNIFTKPFYSQKVGQKIGKR